MEHRLTSTGKRARAFDIYIITPRKITNTVSAAFGNEEEEEEVSFKSLLFRGAYKLLR